MSPLPLAAPGLSEEGVFPKPPPNPPNAPLALALSVLAAVPKEKPLLAGFVAAEADDESAPNEKPELDGVSDLERVGLEEPASVESALGAPNENVEEASTDLVSEGADAGADIPKEKPLLGAFETSDGLEKEKPPDEGAEPDAVSGLVKLKPLGDGELDLSTDPPKLNPPVLAAGASDFAPKKLGAPVSFVVEPSFAFGAPNEKPPVAAGAFTFVVSDATALLPLPKERLGTAFLADGWSSASAERLEAVEAVDAPKLNVPDPELVLAELPKKDGFDAEGASVFSSDLPPKTLLPTVDLPSGVVFG